MDLNKNLSTLIERTWDLHVKINKEIHYDIVSFCKHCLDHGVCCGIAETTEEERRRLIAIRDSLKDVQDMLVFIQTLEASNQQHENGAFARLETSRMLLIERINQYPGQARKVDVLEELNSWFSDKEAPFTWKFKERRGKNMETPADNIASNPVVNCIRSLFNPWNWYNTARMAIKLVVVSTLVSSSFDLYRARQQIIRPPKNILRPKDRQIAGKLEFLVKDDSTGRIHVLQGRG